MLRATPVPQWSIDPGSASRTSRMQGTLGRVSTSSESVAEVRGADNEDEKVRRSIRINRGHGLHLRVCSAIVTAARSVDGGENPTRVLIHKGDQVAEATSILDLMSLGADHGEYVTLSASGPQAAAVLDALAPLLTSSEV